MYQPTSTRCLNRAVSVVIIIMLKSVAVPATAQVKPGDTIGPNDVGKIRELVGPGVVYKVKNGMTMKIVPSQRMDWPPPFKEATEKYSAQVRLSADHRSMVGYVAGQPFPLIDANDPDVATKIAWNLQFRPLLGDDFDLRFFDCFSEYNGLNKSYQEFTHFLVGHYSGYSLVNRTEVEPMPVDPDFKVSGRLWVTGAHPLMSPHEWAGAGFIRYRYADPNRPDDQWAWLPNVRRVRRLNDAFMSSSALPTPWNPDHYSGFIAKTEFYDWKFLGEKDMLACVHAEHSPEVQCPTDGGASACPELWEMRHVYIVQATPRQDKVPGALHSKSVSFVDAEIWWNTYVDDYDRRGELWQSFVYFLAYRDRPVPDARIAIYPFKRAFVVGAVATDEQSSSATMCYLPSPKAPERECWYISMGAVDKDFFTTEALVKDAP